MPAMDYAQVAHLYDLYAQTDLDHAFFIAAARDCRAVLELTAGTGRLSLPLLAAGVPLTCVDSSPEMLAILRRKLAERGLSAPVYAMDITRLELPERYDLILIPFNSFAELTAPEDQRRCLAGIRAHLAPAGRFICTLHNPAVRLRGVTGQRQTRGQYRLPDDAGTLVLSSVERYDPEAGQVAGEQIYEIYAADGRQLSESIVPLTFSLLDRAQFEDLAQAAGFQVEQVFGDYQRRPFDPAASPFIIEVLRAAP